MKAYICDRCGIVVENNRLKREMLNLQLRNDRVGVFAEKHLCEDCRKKFDEFIKNEKMLKSEE